MNPSTERTTMNPFRTIAIATVVGLLTLAGCGSDDAQAPDRSGNAPGLQSGGGGIGDIDFDAIQECLSAAGLNDVFPSGVPTNGPSDFPTDRPSDFPSDFPTDGTPPDGFPSGGPSGGPGGGAGGGFGALQDPEVQAALEACGIDLPGPPGGAQ
jgi:hypothetical protein